VTHLHQTTLSVRTSGRAFLDVTEPIAAYVRSSGVRAGLCHVFIQHTSASLVIQENADPAVLRDLARWIDEVAPESSAYEHDAEGPDDMPSHIRSAITKTSEAIPILEGELGLGTWQAIYVWEHRARGHTRKLVVTVVGASPSR
jgi:secondary thiamine-phosphate synthase enzyme